MMSLAASKTSDWAGATPLLAKCLWPKDRRGRSSPARSSRESVLPASRSSDQSDVHAHFSKARMQRRRNRMSILKAPPKQPKNEALQLRIDEELKIKLEKYAEFLDSTESYVVSEALRLVFNKDA